MRGKKGSADAARSSSGACENVILAQVPAFRAKDGPARSSVNSGVDTAPGAANTQRDVQSDVSLEGN